MTNIFDMLTTVIYVAVPAFVGVGLLVVFTRWLVGLWAYTTTAQAEARSAQLEAQYNEALRALDVQQRALRVDLVQPDVNGLLPVTKAAIDQNGRALITLASQYIDSRKALPVMPQQLHYAPHITHAKPDSKALEMAELPQLMQAAQALPPPDFWKLYHADQLPERGFLLGMNTEDGQPVIADWTKLYSCLVGGKSGSGKSTLVRGLLAQAALQGARFVLVDPHGNAGEESTAASLQPMQSLMLMPPAIEDDQIRDALKFVETTVHDRLHGNPDRTPLVLVIDELTGLIARGRVAKEVENALALLTQESRKVGVFALGIGQLFQSSTFPTVVRNGFASFISCKTRQDMGRVMTGSNEFGKLAESLVIGQAVYQSPQGETITLSVPNCTQHHIELVAKSVGNGHYDAASTAATEPLPSPGESCSAIGLGDDAGSGSGSGEGSGATTGRADLVLDQGKITLIRAMINAGKSKAEILREVWNVQSGGGRKFQTAAKEYDEIVRAIIQEKEGQQ